MADRPIIFSSAMVRAILEGRKTQTRRVVKPQPPDWLAQHLDTGFRVVRHLHGNLFGAMAGSGDVLACRSEDAIRCPYGAPGDTLWVREAWCYEADPVTSKTTARVLYRATDTCDFIDDGDGYPVENKDGTHRSPWKSPLHMPRSASRLTLLVKSVRVERLQEISEEDAIAEGMTCWVCSGPINGTSENDCACFHTKANAIPSFQVGWDSINGKRAPWSSNPYVWALSFERVKEAARD